MRRGIGRLRAGGSSGDADANAWAAAVTANGGTYSAATLAAVTAFTVSAKASGYWTKLNRINLFCGNQLAAALVPLKVGGGSATDTNNNFVGGDYTEATGLTGNGTTKYLNTGVVPSTSLTLDSTHIAVYNRSAAVGGTAFNGSDDPTNFLVLAPPTSGGTIQSYQGCIAGNQATSAAISTPYGMIIGTRTGTNAQAIYQNAASVATSGAASASSVLPALAMYVFARNGNGTPTDFGSQVYAAYSFGAGLTGADVTAYTTHMTTFQTALSRNV